MALHYVLLADLLRLVYFGKLTIPYWIRGARRRVRLTEPRPRIVIWSTKEIPGEANHEEIGEVEQAVSRAVAESNELAGVIIWLLFRIVQTGTSTGL